MKTYLRATVLAGVFIMPFIPLIVANSLFFPFITGKNFLFRILVEIVFVAWALLALYEPKYRPRFSWILVAFTAFVAAIFVADVTGLNPEKSLWSNFERMEGFVSLAHVGLYTLVVGHSLLTRKMWNYYFNTILAAASLVALYAFAQLGGAIQINQGGVRVDATLGNAAYFAVYMLFSTFIATLMLVRASSRNIRIVYGALALMFAYLLFESATRGTILGLVGGTAVAATYIAIFARNSSLMARRLSLGILVAVIVCVGAFVNFKDSDFVKNSPVLNRISTISVEAGSTRFIIWGMALEGFKERPILGWGQENFNYVFNKYYDPRLYGDEPWFDRVHNIFFDWLIAGGAVGLLLYFFLYFSALFHAVFRPLVRPADEEEGFSVLEQGVILGLFAGYLFHNFFVFDNIISYFFYGTMLAFIHNRVGAPMPRLMRWSTTTKVLDNVAVPAGAFVLVVAVYFCNVPGLLAASHLINGFKATTPEARMAAFDSALSQGSFGTQEIREQLTRVTQQTLQEQGVPEEVKGQFKTRTVAELVKQVEATPEDARIRVFISSFYRVIGQPENAIAELEKALELSPQKQQIMFEKGLSHLQLNQPEQALEVFRKAYELEPNYTNARMFYAAGSLYANDQATFDELITSDYRDAYYQNDFVLRATYDARRFDLIEDILHYRVEAAPGDLQLRVSYAAAIYEGGDTARAIEILEQAIVDFPDFKAQGEQYLTQLRAGPEPVN